MSYSIVDNYSILNSYNYTKKPVLSSCLDWLSTPCRRVLGGKNVCVLSQTYQYDMSTAFKVMTVFLSVLIFPVAVVSIASLIIKMATCPSFWERKKVIDQSGQAWRFINQFQQNFQEGKYQEAISAFRQQPEIIKREEINTDLFIAINREINKQVSFEQIEQVLSYLKVDDAIELVNHAVKTRLSDEIENKNIATSPTDIINFIKNVFNRNKQACESCMERLLSDALQVDTNDDIVLNCIKMEIAHGIITALVNTQIESAKDQLDIELARLQRSELKNKIFKLEQTSSNYKYFWIFRAETERKMLCTYVKSIRTIHQLGRWASKELENLSSKTDITQQVRWKNFRAVFSDLFVSLNQLSGSLDPQEEYLEQDYISSLQNLCTSVLDFVDLLSKTSDEQLSTSLDELASIFQTIENIYKTHHEKIKKISLVDHLVAANPADSHILLALKIKKTGELVHFCEEIKRALDTQFRTEWANVRSSYSSIR